MKMQPKNNRELLIMVCINFAIIFVIYFISLNKNITNNNYNYETNTYVQYIDRSDSEIEKLPIAGITEVQFEYLSDSSLSGDTSDVESTVTDSQQEFQYYPESRYSIDWSDNDKYLLAKIAQCEAGNQNIRTKELVVLVVLNRVYDEQFPDTIEEVIKENHNGVYQFSPLVQGGSWYGTEPSDEAYIAVQNVIESLYDYSDGALYFESCTDEDNWHSRNLEFLYQSESMRFYK